MDIHRLRCVVSLAQLKSVTRAAEQNFITQSTMSSTISSIESELGVRLFTRGKREISLTPAGERFVAAAEEIIQKYDAVLAQVRSNPDGVLSRVVLGFNSISVVGMKSGIIMELLQKMYPTLSIRFSKYSISELTQSLLDGRTDIIFTNHFEARNNPKAHYITFANTQPCVFMQKGHRLTEKEVLTIEDLENETLFCASNEGQPQKLAVAGEMLRMAGVPYTPESPVANEEAIISMVEAGIGLYPAVNWFKLLLDDRVDCVPLELDIEGPYAVVMWVSEEYEGIAQDLAHILRSIFSKLQDETSWSIC